MTKRLPETDVVVIGLGWAGSILAHELAVEGLQVVGLERGPWRDTAADFNIASAADELRYSRRKDLMVRTAQNTITMRNNPSQTALPMREWGSFHIGNGAGGGGNHWAGLTWRFQPNEFRLHSHYKERYGAGSMQGLTLQDWGTDWEEMEPYYDAFEKLAGISGTAGNLNGKIVPGGNPYEGSRTSEFPTPAAKVPYTSKLFAEAAISLGYTPFPTPSATISTGYTNPLGITMGPCTYCGFCVNYGCANYSKASAITTILPALMRKPNFTARTHCEVLKIVLDATGKNATGVVYVDSNGEQWEQPASLVICAAFTFENVRLMLLSNVGKPYDPMTNTGTTGRNYSYQTANRVLAFFDEERFNFNPFIGGGAIGMAIDDFNNDNFDHTGLGFLGGCSIRLAPTGAAPINVRPVPAGTPAWGSDWKKETVRSYASTMNVTCEGTSYSTRNNYLSLDPNYVDRLGRPLLQVTFDFPENDRKMAQFCVDKTAGILESMNPRSITKTVRNGHWDSAPYQSSHVCGGFVMGTTPANSSVNKYLQVWDVPNLFVVGASAFPQNAGYNPTGTVGALAFKAADAIRTRYLKKPGEMISL